MSQPQVVSSVPSKSGNDSRRRTESPDSNETPPQSPMQSLIPPYLRSVVFPYHGDFAASQIFAPQLIVQLMAEGFLPIAIPTNIPDKFYLLPKLHLHRCCISLPHELHLSKSLRKKSKRFSSSLTVNTCFRKVVAECQNQHENCWLYQPLVQALDAIQNYNFQAILQSNNGENKRTKCRVRVYSIELWSHGDDDDDDEKTLIAGELGYSVGTIYTSLTGFSSQSSAGSIQLAALGQLLIQQGFTTWDLGMDMLYKRQMGASLVPRTEFLKLIHQARRVPIHHELTNDGITNKGSWNAQELILSAWKQKEEPADVSLSSSPTSPTKKLKATKEDNRKKKSKEEVRAP